MRRDQAILVLGLEGRLEEAVHELQGLLLVLNESATIDALQVDVEVPLILAAFDQPLELIGLLREQLAEVERLHGVHGDLLPVPLHGPEDFRGGSHIVQIIENVCNYLENNTIVLKQQLDAEKVKDM